MLLVIVVSEQGEILTFGHILLSPGHIWVVHIAHFMLIWCTYCMDIGQFGVYLLDFGYYDGQFVYIRYSFLPKTAKNSDIYLSNSNVFNQMVK